MKLFFRGWIAVLVLTLFGVTPAQAQYDEDPEVLARKKDQKGAFIRDIYEYPNCLIGYLKVRYFIEVNGEKPRVTVSMKWEGGPGAKPDCLPQGTVVSLAVNSYSRSRAYINMTPGIPVSGADFGKEVTQTFEWDQLLCGWGRKHAKKCFPAEDAKYFFKSGYAVTDVELWAP